MKIAIIYKSTHHQNTRRVAEAIAATLQATLITVDEAAEFEGKDFDLVGFGSGIYFGRHHQALRHLAETWPSLPGCSFVFSTAGLPWMASLWHRSLTNALTRRGSKVIGHFCCSGWDTVGPLWLLGGLNRTHPNEQDLARAIRFARSLPGDESTYVA